MFILVMCILFKRISNTHDFCETHQREMSIRQKKLVAQKLLLRGKIKKVLSRAHVRLLEQRARNAHDQNEQTSLYISVRKRIIFLKTTQ